jgi:hypothetical protein
MRSSYKTPLPHFVVSNLECNTGPMSFWIFGNFLTIATTTNFNISWKNAPEVHLLGIEK